jgi:hypothetical protein
MGQSPTETTEECETDDGGAPAGVARARQSGAEDGATVTDNPAIGREWTEFAGANEYERDLAAPEWETSADPVVGREWHDFAGTNEYGRGESSSDLSATPETSPENEPCVPSQSGD